MKVNQLPLPPTKPCGLRFPTGLPAPPLRGQGRPAFKDGYYSVKNGCYVPYPSGGGLRALYYAEVCTEVVSYRTHLEPVRLKIGGQSMTYTAHLEETLIDGHIIVTEFMDMLSEDNPARLAAIPHAREHYAGRGVGFRVHGRPASEVQATFEAAEAIQSFRHTRFTYADILRVKSAIGERSSGTLGEVRNLFKSPALGFAKLSAMMVRRIIAIDLTQGLGATTPVRLLDPR